MVHHHPHTHSDWILMNWDYDDPNVPEGFWQVNFSQTGANILGTIAPFRSKADARTYLQQEIPLDGPRHGVIVTNWSDRETEVRPVET